MKFPKLLNYAVLRGNEVCFPLEVLDSSDPMIVEYMQWKSALGINVLTKRKLRHLYDKNQYVTEISAIFERSAR